MSNIHRERKVKEMEKGRKVRPETDGFQVRHLQVASV